MEEIALMKWLWEHVKDPALAMSMGANIILYKLLMKREETLSANNKELGENSKALLKLSGQMNVLVKTIGIIVAGKRGSQ